jgi:large subunit ribosomal protein L30
VAKLKVTQVRSTVGKPRRLRDTVRALGLRRIRHSVIQEDRPEIRGMLARVRHLVDVEDAEE